MSDWERLDWKHRMTALLPGILGIGLVLQGLAGNVYVVSSDLPMPKHLIVAMFPSFLMIVGAAGVFITRDWVANLQQSDDL